MTLSFQILHGNCLNVLNTFENNSIEAVVTDPPYGISFMGSKWDYDIPSTAVWKEVLRVLKPGGHLLAFSSTRTYHRMAVNIEDAGFEVRDQLQWLYGSGFPKSLDVSKALDKYAGNTHPTVKPTELMRYLVKLITPQGGTVLDPFCGSGSTGKAALLEGANFVGIELNEEYVQLATRRLQEYVE